MAVADYGRDNQQWLKTFLELPHGIPSHDTFNDLFSRLAPEPFEKCFMEWMNELVELSQGRRIAELIIANHGDYLLQAKATMDEAILQGFKGMPHGHWGVENNLHWQLATGGELQPPLPHGAESAEKREDGQVRQKSGV